MVDYYYCFGGHLEILISGRLHDICSSFVLIIINTVGVGVGVVDDDLVFGVVILLKCGIDTSILHPAFISIFIALWVVIARYITILMAILSYFTRFIMKRENAGSGDLGLEKEQILETYSAQLQKSTNSTGLIFGIYKNY